MTTRTGAQPTATETLNQPIWFEHFASLIDFYMTHNRIPQKTNCQQQGEQKLGKWVDKQRQNGKLLMRGLPSKMSRQKFDMLNSLPWWAWTIDDEKWLNKLNATIAFRIEHQRWPRKRATDDGERALALWINNNKVHGRLHAAGQPSKMTAKRYAQLDNITDWSWGQQPDN